MVGLYEQAQACTMVLPRLYLLNTVGACYILSKEAPARVSPIDVLMGDNATGGGRGKQKEGSGGRGGERRTERGGGRKRK